MRNIQFRDSQETPEDNDSSTHQSDNNIFLNVVGGVNKKGRVYGLGSGGWEIQVFYFCLIIISVSSSEYEQMKVLVSSLTTENKSFKTVCRLIRKDYVSNEELVRSSQEESRLLRDQLFRFMDTISLDRSSTVPSRLDPHELTPTDQDNEEADHGFDNEPRAT
ncbi:hypothetical protein SESBI_25059 [Sesbania bispinosa]|nr:hypothetical protein SESBI_25059 [Sesbania bispinosa]